MTLARHALNFAPAASAQDAAHLLETLDHLAARAQMGDVSCVRACRPHQVQAVELNAPLLSLVISGRKRVLADGVDITALRGDAVFVTRAGHFDLQHGPDEAAGRPFQSMAIPLCDEVMQAARLLWGRPVVAAGAVAECVPIATMAAVLQQWADALLRGDTVGARMALAAALIELAHRGNTQALLPPVPSWGQRIRRMVEAQPQRLWQSRDFEVQFQTSGATLRRRLLAEQTSLRTLIVQARLAVALQLLYTTDWPIKTVAARAGYASTAAFTRQFTERYGLSPSAIGNAGIGPAD